MSKKRKCKQKETLPVVVPGSLRSRVRSGEVSAQDAWDCIKHSVPGPRRSARTRFMNKGAVDK
jgi:hypothetical protein